MSSFFISKKDIDLIVYDFDGVMTDNKVLVFNDGKEAVFCNRSDGMAVQKIKKLGVAQLIISAEQNRIVKVRADKLGIRAVQGVRDKKTALLDYCRRKKYDPKKVIYVGNDLNDLEAMKLVGYPVAPQDACRQIKKIAKITTKAKGGEGVIRELYGRIID